MKSEKEKDFKKDEGDTSGETPPPTASPMRQMEQNNNVRNIKKKRKKVKHGLVKCVIHIKLTTNCKVLSYQPVFPVFSVSYMYIT